MVFLQDMLLNKQKGDQKKCFSHNLMSVRTQCRLHSLWTQLKWGGVSGYAVNQQPSSLPSGPTPRLRVQQLSLILLHRVSCIVNDKGCILETVRVKHQTPQSTVPQPRAVITSSLSHCECGRHLAICIFSSTSWMILFSFVSTSSIRPGLRRLCVKTFIRSLKEERKKKKVLYYHTEIIQCCFFPDTQNNAL